MSKKKKTIDELLEEAIVPEEEQPYQVPENWVWVKFDSVIKVSSNRAVSVKQKDYEEEGIPVIDQGMQLISGFTNNQESVYTGELPVIVFGDHTKCLKWIDFKFAQGADGTKLLKPLEPLYAKYFYYLLNVINLPDKGYSRHFKYLRDTVFPIPPIHEQKAITKKVDRFLNKLEEAKQLIEEAKETFELRRIAILDKAFRGDLTKKWRKENLRISFTTSEGDIYQIPKEWKWTTIGEITTFVGSGSTPKGGSKVYQRKGIPFIRSQNVLRNEMSIEDIVHITEEIHDNMKRTHMHGNETLLNITGASIGRAAKLKKELVPCNVNQHVCALRFIEGINEELPQYWLNSPFLQKKINELQIGATRQALNFPQVKSLPFPLIPQEEQTEILRIIDSLLGKENKLTQLEEMDKKIDTLRQSILSKAFRGELGTNDPTEESALELLKEVLQEKIQ